MAFAILPNQGRFPLDDVLFRLRDESQQAKNDRDARIRHALGQFAPSALNATLTYEKEGEIQLVRVSPNAARKAADRWFFEEGHQTLVSAQSYLDPTLELVWELLWRNLQGDLNPIKLALYRARIKQALSKRHGGDDSLRQLHEALCRCEGMLPPSAPLGF